MRQLPPVRLQQIGATITDVVAALWIDDDERARLARCADDFERHPLGQHPLRIVGDDHHRMRGHQLARQPQQILADIRIKRHRSLAIGPQQLLVGRNVTRFDGSRALRLDQDVDFRAFLRLKQPADLSAAVVVTDDRDERCRSPQGDEVAQHVAGAAQALQLALDAQNRDRRFGRDPLDLAIDVMIQHHVPDAQHAGRFQALDMRKQVAIVGHHRIVGSGVSKAFLAGAARKCKLCGYWHRRPFIAAGAATGRARPLLHAAAGPRRPRESAGAAPLPRASAAPRSSARPVHPDRARVR